MRPSTLAVFLPNWVGDVVMATPALRALRQFAGPDAILLGVMRPYVADVLAGTHWLDEQLFYDPRSSERHLGSFNLIRQLRSRRPDTAVLMTNSLRTGMLAYLSGARRRIGYVRYGRGPLLTDRLIPPQLNGQPIKHPMVDYYLGLSAAAGCPPESPRLELATTPDDERAADLLWRQLGLRDGQRVVVFNSSGAFGAAKLWPTEHFAALAQYIAGELDHDVLVLCGPKEREIARQIVAGAKHPRVFSLADHPLSIGLSKACVRRCRLMVTTDSGPRHFGVAFGVPLVSLFGPTPAIWGANPTSRETALALSDLECFGCHRRVCPLGHHRCMRDLTVDRVAAAVAAELGQQRSRSAA